MGSVAAGLDVILSRRHANISVSLSHRSISTRRPAVAIRQLCTMPAVIEHVQVNISTHCHTHVNYVKFCVARIDR